MNQKNHPYWSQTARQLTPYVPGEQPQTQQPLIKLNTNENPYPPSPKVLEALQQTANARLRLYPDPEARALKQQITGYYQLRENQVFVGNGSDEVLAHTFVALLKQDKSLLMPQITYSFYPVYCQLFGIDYETIALDQTMTIDLSCYSENNGGVIFANPNAPTGIALPLTDIEAFLCRNTDSVVVVDEAYIDFGADSAVRLINKYPQLLVIQTFSKSRSLAGLRVGFAMGHADLISALERVKNSFNSYPLDRFAINGALAALADQDYFQQCVERIIQSRAYVSQQLQQLGFEVLPSSANFVFVRHPHYQAEKLAQDLRARNIIVRHFNQDILMQYLRISIGTDAECEQLIRQIRDIMAG